MVDRRLTGDVTLADIQYGDDRGLEFAEEVRDDDGEEDDDDVVDRARGFVADDTRFLLYKEGVQERGPNGWAKAMRRGEFAMFEARTLDPRIDPKTGRLKGILGGDGKGGDGGLSLEEVLALDEALGIADSVNGAANAAVDGRVEQTQVPYFTVKTGEFKGERVTLYFFRNLGGQMVIEFDGGKVDRGKLLGGTIRMEFTEGRLRGRSVFVAPNDLQPAGEFAACELDKHLRAVVREKDKLRIQREAIAAKAKGAVANGSKRGGKRVAGKGKRAKSDRDFLTGLR